MFGAPLLSACSGDPSCDETRTCAPGAIGTGGKTTNDAGTGARAGTGGTSGMTGSGGNTGSGGGGAKGGAGTAGTDGGDAGDAADAGREAETGPKCSGTVGLREEGCPIEDPEGIFVSRAVEAGTGDGSRAHPFTSIGAAVHASLSNGDAGSGDGGSAKLKRVYVCGDEGAYAEILAFDASNDGLAFYGGFRCAD